jgi:GntR family transcriptional regulator / MocR family aminotransferase
MIADGPVDLLVAVDGGQNLGEQVYRRIRDAITDGRVLPDSMLPSTRDMAAQLAISRTTVAKAYERLAADGYIRARSGSGSYVNHIPRFGDVSRSHESPLRARPVWNAITEPADMSVVTAEFDFRSGIPDASQFPYSTWRSLMGSQMRQGAVGKATHINAAGHRGLRVEIGRHIGVSRGVPAAPDEIVVTSGSQQAIDLIGRVLVEPGDVVAVEDPGYLPPFRAFTALGARVVGVPVDEDGLIVEALPAQARLVYVTPAHQYPLGMTMSMPRRRALLQWARHCDAAIVEDDYDGQFRYAGRPLEPLYSLDSSGRVVYVGSFSKVTLPTLRLGFLVAPASIQPALRKAKHVSDWHTEVPLQAAMAKFIERGSLARHIRRMRRIYSTRHHLVRASLSRYLADRLVPLPSAGGIHLATLLADPDTDDTEVARRAAAAGVAVQPLSYFAHSTPARSGLVLGYGAIPVDRIDEGLRRLRSAIEQSTAQVEPTADVQHLPGDVRRLG